MGDEFQALFSFPHELPFAVEHVCHGLINHHVRFGIGYGSVTTSLKRTAVGMDGPCFHRARRAIEAAKQQKKSIVVYPAELDERVTDVWNLALTIIMERTARQAETIEAYRTRRKQSETAAALGVTQGTVSVDLARSHFAECEAVLRHLGAMLAEASRGSEP